MPLFWLTVSLLLQAPTVCSPVAPGAPLHAYSNPAALGSKSLQPNPSCRLFPCSLFPRCSGLRRAADKSASKARTPLSRPDLRVQINYQTIPGMTQHSNSCSEGLYFVVVRLLENIFLVFLVIRFGANLELRWFSVAAMPCVHST